MTKKPVQLELEDAIQKAGPYPELHCVVTGEVFQPWSRNHYETNSGVPFAPPVDLPRPTIRQRIENLLSRGVDPLAAYVGTEGIDMEVPDDPEAPLTASECNYLDTIAEELAEQAPLPDEGLPRSQPAPSMQQTGAEGGGEPEGGVHSASAPPSEEPPPVRSKPGPRRTVVST